MHLCIIPDLHNRIEVAKEIIEKENENVDEFIFLGDYFDDWTETLQSARATAEFLSEHIHDDKFKFLIGNHDLHYIINHRSWISSTWTEEKFNTINEIIDEDMWSKFLWSYHKDNWLFSHAGINSKDYSSEGLDDTLNAHITDVIDNDLDTSKWFSPYGKFWLKYLSGIPLALNADRPLNQMCGHSVLANWNMKQLVGYRVYWIDTCSQNYALVDLEENTVNIRNTSYNHSYHSGEIKWLSKINQIKNL